jgi:hypothetical protein
MSYSFDDENRLIEYTRGTGCGYSVPLSRSLIPRQNRDVRPNRMDTSRPDSLILVCFPEAALYKRIERQLGRVIWRWKPPPEIRIGVPHWDCYGNIALAAAGEEASFLHHAPPAAFRVFQYSAVSLSLTAILRPSSRPNPAFSPFFKAVQTKRFQSLNPLTAMQAPAIDPIDQPEVSPRAKGKIAQLPKAQRDLITAPRNPPKTSVHAFVKRKLVSVIVGSRSPSFVPTPANIVPNSPLISHSCFGTCDAVTFLWVALPAPQMALVPAARDHHSRLPAKAIAETVRHAEARPMYVACYNKTARVAGPSWPEEVQCPRASSPPAPNLSIVHRLS